MAYSGKSIFGRSLAAALCILLLGAFAPQAAHAQQQDTLRRGLSLRSNLFYAASATPNLGFELPLGDHFSLGMNAGLKTWPRFLFWDGDDPAKPKHWKHLLVAPELRFWPDAVYEGWFLGADLIYTHFNVGAVRFPFGMYPDVRNYRLQGDFYGIGLFGGHSWWLGERWRIEAEAGLGVGYKQAGIYECEHCGTRLGARKGLALVPKMGLNLSYLFRRKAKHQPEEPAAR